MLIFVMCLSAASFLALALLLHIRESSSSSSIGLLRVARTSDVDRLSCDLCMGSYVLLGSGTELFGGSLVCESGITGFLVDVLRTGLLGGFSRSVDLVPGRICGLDVK